MCHSCQNSVYHDFGVVRYAVKTHRTTIADVSLTKGAATPAATPECHLPSLSTGQLGLPLMSLALIPADLISAATHLATSAWLLYFLLLTNMPLSVLKLP